MAEEDDSCAALPALAAFELPALMMLPLELAPLRALVALELPALIASVAELPALSAPIALDVAFGMPAALDAVLASGLLATLELEATMLAGSR